MLDHGQAVGQVRVAQEAAELRGFGGGRGCRGGLHFQKELGEKRERDCRFLGEQPCVFPISIPSGTTGFLVRLLVCPLLLSPRPLWT